MLIVRGVNVFPTAVREVVGGFAPEVSGVVAIRPRRRGVQQAPPLPVVVELGRGPGADAGARRRDRGAAARRAARGGRGRAGALGAACRAATTSRSSWTGRAPNRRGGEHAQTADPGRAPHHAGRGRPADLDRLLGGRARHALRVRAAEPRPRLREPPLLRSRRRAADHRLHRREPQARARADADRHRLRAPPGAGGQPGDLQAGGRAAGRARHPALRGQGPRLHGLDLLQGPARAIDRARRLPLRAAVGLHPRPGAAGGAQDPGRAQRLRHRRDPPRRRHRAAERAQPRQPVATTAARRTRTKA